MKKIIALCVMALAFGVNANAQQKKTTVPAKPTATTVTPPATKVNQADITAKAGKDLTELNNLVTLTKDQVQQLQPVFAYKYQTYAEVANLSQERKDILSQGIEAKIKGVLTPDQAAKLDSNQALLKRLTH